MVQDMFKGTHVLWVAGPMTPGAVDIWDSLDKQDTAELDVPGGHKDMHRVAARFEIKDDMTMRMWDAVVIYYTPLFRSIWPLREWLESKKKEKS